MKRDRSVGIVTQTGKGIPNNQYEPATAVAHQPPTKAIAPSMLSKRSGGSAHSVDELKDVRGK